MTTRQSIIHKFATALLSAVLLGALLNSTSALAEKYPSHRINVFIPYGPGGTDDLIGRTIGNKLGKLLGVPVVMQYHPGVGGTIAEGMLAREKPDGYTIAIGDSGQLAIAPNIYKKLEYEPLKTVIPIINLVNSDRVLVVRSSLHVKTLKQLIAMAKAHPGKLTYASVGTGSSAWLNMELFKSLAHVNILQIPFHSSPASIQSILAGRVDMNIIHVSNVLQLVNTGKLRMLATTSQTRLPDAPNVPTMAQAGVPGYKADIFVGVMAPGGTPRPIVMKLNHAINKVLKEPSIEKFFNKNGFTVNGGTPEQFATAIREDGAQFGKLIRKAHIPLR